MGPDQGAPALLQYEKMKKQHVRLSKKDGEKLKALVSRGSLRRRELKRAKALLALDRGGTFKEVSTAIDISSATISSWAGKYRRQGLAFLKDKPRPGRPKNITKKQRAKIVALAKTEPPEGHERWSLRLLAEKAISLGYVNSISHQYINQILKESELQIY